MPRKKINRGWVPASHALIAWDVEGRRSWAVVVPDDQWNEEGLAAIRARMEHEAAGSCKNGVEMNVQLTWETRKLT